VNQFVRCMVCQEAAEFEIISEDAALFGVCRGHVASLRSQNDDVDWTKTMYRPTENLPRRPSYVYTPRFPSWVVGAPRPDDVMAEILHEMESSREYAWTALDARHRGTVLFGHPFGGDHIGGPTPFSVHVLAVTIAAVYGIRVNSCALNVYPTGDAIIDWHRDSVADIEPRVLVYSVGCDRTMLFRDARTYWPRLLEAGSILDMGREVLEDWEHAVLSEPRSTMRMSLSFRRVLGGPDVLL
jgi:hypothetical protein